MLFGHASEGLYSSPRVLQAVACNDTRSLDKKSADMAVAAFRPSHKAAPINAA